MAEEVVMAKGVHAAIIVGIIGSILCILVILAIVVNIAVYLNNKKAAAKFAGSRRRSVTASNHDNEDMSRNMYILAYITLGFVCVNITRYIHPIENTMYKKYKIGRKTNLAVAALFGTLSLTFALTLQLGPKNFVNKTVASSGLKYCANDDVSIINYVGWLGGYGTQTLYNIYVLVMFLSRFKRIKHTMLSSFKDEVNRVGTPCKSDVQRFKKILKLNRLMIKMCTLVITSVAITWIYIFVGLYSIDISFAVSWSLMVDTLCMFLLFSSITEPYWNVLVKICYWPCCCWKLCPSIKQGDELDLQQLRKHTELNHVAIPTCTTTETHSYQTETVGSVESL